MQFSKLRLSGFKSFVDATEMLIEPGMTGIVGPNGCGKSNLVEALRWVMGESSAKKMRGDEMDDVIFGGTAQRPARNLAEVTLCVDNSGRTAPAGFNDLDEMEIVRRIERGAGSDYRINSKPARARDVQLLFADNSSGANSAALVSQGRVGALINAKPEDRRLLLEEAAGITGLHSRRHEAELRLKAAETNLTRLDDILVTMESQLQGLAKQAKRAARYRTLSEQIRHTEASLLHRRWRAAEDDLITARNGFAEAEAAVQSLMASVTGLTNRRADQATGLPPLRQAQAEAATTVQRLIQAREQLDGEEQRVAAARTRNQNHLEQLLRDLVREKSLAGDAEDALTRLASEQERLAAAQIDEEMLREATETAVDDATDAVETVDRELTALTERIAADEAQRVALQRQANEIAARMATAGRRLDEQCRQREALAQQIAAQPDLAASETALAAAEESLEICRDAADSAERAKAESEAAERHSRERYQAAEAARTRLRAEASALSEVLAAGSNSGLFPPLIDAIEVEAGSEAALAVALGDDLDVPLDEAAAVHWRSLPPFDRDAAPPIPALPEGVVCLATRVEAPPALSRRLSHIGIVADAIRGAALAPRLHPGQALVTLDGAAWRWDGLTVRAGAPTAAAIRLKQRNRLAVLHAEQGAAEENAAAAKDVLDEARRHASDAASRDRQARDAVRNAFATVGQARDRHARLAQTAAAAASKLAALDEAIGRLGADREDIAAQAEAADRAIAVLPDTAAARRDMAELRARVAERRTDLATRQNARDRTLRDITARRQRLNAIVQEQHGWQSRSAGADDRVRELVERTATVRQELETLAARPAEIEGERQALLTRLAEAQRGHKRATEALGEAERQLDGAERALRQAEAGLADGRETRVRAEAAVGACLHNQQTIRARITEKLNCAPEDLAALATLAEGEAVPPIAAVEARLEKLQRERETMGPVNLRAELEATELDQQIQGMQTERSDLIAAIGRLRQGIGTLNKEARDRLLASFDVVDQHFQDLFVRLFGGGKAYLKLTNADDPLDAGLEIFASPPGKKLQALTLLSGGEQALTALALLFAVFLTNPAPICVLDEVDAPLDEANVDRFCTLVEDMARREATRFLVITHHRLTMARMDRLFGVTMMERGVSRLVSVDLRGAEEIGATS
ncbi:MAG: chromosome segregation protein SMC [Azospirillaceae bacterium]|nr:chromosome segregation protein SMC [Azospirillaceae bacterium]